MAHRTDTPPERTGSPPDDLDQRIGQALTRLEDAIGRKPGFGRSTSVATTRLVDGLRCVSYDGDHQIGADLGPALGGYGTGPTPSALVRAALGSCLAMGYRLRAARHGVPVASIRVEVETDSSISGMIDPGSAFPPGFLQVRYCVDIESSAPGEQVEAMIEEGDRLSPVLDVVAGASPVSRVLSITTTGGGR